ncbi:MAG TPA: DinB family protein [Dehalococcoidia bacterium]|nr:DinB family protein [Dehalococcoidia bacterium]
MTSYGVTVVRRADGSADGWVNDLPGCRATAASYDEMWRLLPIVVAEHLAWLAGHGEPVSPNESFGFEVIEDTESRGEFAFEADKPPLTAEELERGIRHAAYAHADLLHAAGRLPDAVLDWRPPPSSVKIDQIFPDVRSIRQMLEHVAATEAFFYVGSLSDEPRSGPPAEAPPPLADLHSATAARLRGLPAESLARVFRRTGPRGEMEWTARKVLRRIVSHKRFHTREIQQRLSWLVLGVPEVLPRNRE